MNTCCNIRSKTTCRRTTVVQQQDLPAAAASAAAPPAAAGACCRSSSRGMLQQQAAETTSSRKHQQTEVRSILCADWHPLESAPSLFRCLLRPRPSSTTINEMKKSDKALVPSSRRPDRLGILWSSYLHNHQASSAVSAPQQRPRQGSTVVNKAS